VFLRSLAYLVEQDEQYPILDVQGTEVGQLSVALTPCNSNGKEILGEFVEDPKELVNNSTLNRYLCLGWKESRIQSENTRCSEFT
jgi:hypothetical protein